MSDSITALGEFLGVALGVVGLSFIAGMQVNDEEVPRMGVSANNRNAEPQKSSSASRKQTIAGGVTGANNPKKSFPGMPRKSQSSQKQSQTDANDAAILDDLLGGMAAKVGVVANAKETPAPRAAAAAAAATTTSAAATKDDNDNNKGGLGGMMSGILSGAEKATESLASAAAAAKQHQQQQKKFSYTWGAAEAMGPREYMEDAWCVRENGFAGGYFFASVMDGHGGAASSAYLRENLFSALNAEARKTIHPPAIGGSGGGGGSPPGMAPDGTPNGGYLASALKSAYDGADDSLIDHVARLGEPECWSGSTCTSVLLRDDRVVAANVGDSRALLVRSGKPIVLTQDHRPVGSNKSGRKELDRVMRTGGWSVGGRVCGILAVSRAFGDYEFKGGRFDLLEDLSDDPLAKKATLAEPPVIATPDVMEVARDVAKDEWLILASDGLWDTVNSQQVCSFIKQEIKKKPDISADALADALVKRAIRFRTQDNVAVVVVDLRQQQQQ